MVAAEMASILEIHTDDFWQGITLPMLETVRRRLRALVKLSEYKRRSLVYSDFEDRSVGGIDITRSAARRVSFLGPRDPHCRAQTAAERAVDADRPEGAGAYLS